MTIPAESLQLPLGVPILAVRKIPDHRSEMVNQLIFGETVTIVDQKDHWLYIQSFHDQYFGWIENHAHYFFPANDLEKQKVVCSPLAYVQKANLRIYIPFGAFWQPSWGELLEGEMLDERMSQAEVLKTLYKVFLGAPYLWGGRSIWGIDCSGLSQLYARLLGISLPRDAKDQALMGEEVLFGQWQQGDLVFFSNNQQSKVNHVGIAWKDGYILHASGTVRLDAIDVHGIYHLENKMYTHRYLLAKRIKLPG